MPALFLLSVLGGVATAVLRYAPHTPNWDELYFLHRAVCVNRAAFALDWSALDLCLHEMSKSPILSFLLLFAGDIQGRPELVMILPVALALLTLGVAVLLAWMAHAARLRPLAVVLAGLACALVPHTRAVGGLIFVDTLFALTVAATLLLLPLEMARSAASRTEQVSRGALWGGLAALGILGKLTYGFFALAVFPVLIVLAVRRQGVRALLVRIAAALTVALPAIFVTLRYLGNYIAHAAGASFGDVAQFYGSGQTFGALLREQVLGSGYGLVPLALLGLLALVMLFLRPRHGLAPLYLLSVLAGYFLLVSLSPNRDPRFYLPVWIALPWVLAAFVRSNGAFAPQSWSYAAPAGLLLCMLLAMPTAGSLNLRFVAQARAALKWIAADRQDVSSPPKLVIATDAAGMNVETLLLARELSQDANVHAQRIDTLVYDIVHGITPEGSLTRLRNADYVLFQTPPDQGAPEWANRFHGAFLDEARRNGDAVATIGESPGLTLFRMHKPE